MAQLAGERYQFYFQTERRRNSPGDMLLSHFSQHTRPHSPWAPQSDVTEPGVAHNTSLKSWHLVVNLVFDRFQGLQRGSNLVEAGNWKTSLFQSSTVNNSKFFGRGLNISYHNCLCTCTAD